jgi:hypothetical protein
LVLRDIAQSALVLLHWLINWILRAEKLAVGSVAVAMAVRLDTDYPTPNTVEQIQSLNTINLLYLIDYGMSFALSKTHRHR